MREVTIIEQIGNGKFLWFGRDKPDTLYVARIKVPDKARAGQFFWLQGTLTILIVLLGLLMVGVGNVSGHLVWLFGITWYFGYTLLCYRQVGKFDVKRPHNFKEWQVVDVKMKRVMQKNGKFKEVIASVKPKRPSVIAIEPQ
jgi:hypothetical protein